MQLEIIGSLKEGEVFGDFDIFFEAADELDWTIDCIGLSLRRVSGGTWTCWTSKREEGP